MLLSAVRPLYPQSALIRELEGRVIVQFRVNERGTVEDIAVVESTHKVFEGAAINAVAKFRYQPRIVDGIAVAVDGVRAEILFELD